MPGFNGTGPLGMGPMTGGGRGRCNPRGATAGWRPQRFFRRGSGGYGWYGAYGAAPFAPPAGQGQDLEFLKQETESLRQEVRELKNEIVKLSGQKEQEGR